MTDKMQITIEGVDFPLVNSKTKLVRNVFEEFTTDLSKNDKLALSYVSPAMLLKVSNKLQIKIPKEAKTDANKQTSAYGFSTDGSSIGWLSKIYNAIMNQKSFSATNFQGQEINKSVGKVYGKEETKKNPFDNAQYKMNVSPRTLDLLEKIRQKISKEVVGISGDTGDKPDEPKEFDQIESYKQWLIHPTIIRFKKELVGKDQKPLSDQMLRIKRLWTISLFQNPELLEKIKNAKDEQTRKRLVANLSMNPYDLAFMREDPDNLGTWIEDHTYSSQQQKDISEDRAKLAFEGYVKDPHMIHPATNKPSRQEVSGDPEGAGWYGYAKAYRSFLDLFSAVKFKRGEKGYFQQSTANIAGKYPHLKANEEEMKQLDKCILEGSEKMVTKIGSSKKIHSGKNGLYLAFRIIMECGFRKDEIFTIASSKPTVKAGKDADSGLELTKGVYHLTAYTRKTRWVKKYVHTASVLSKEVAKLITERRKEIENGINAKSKSTALLKYGVDQDSDKHTLIGWDNEFVKVNTLHNKKPSGTGNQTIANNVLRECYLLVRTIDDEGLSTPLDGKDYWMKKPLHYLRHLFAHKWLDITKYNYGLVAKWGHWGTISELERSYGEMPKEYRNSEMVRIMKTQKSTDVITDASEIDSALDYDQEQNDVTEKDVNAGLKGATKI